MTKQEYQYYKNRFFVGYERNGETQLLHFNKRGYELRKTIRKNVVILDSKNKDHCRRFNTIKTSPFSYCVKVPCLQYLFKLEQNLTWWQKLLQYFGLWKIL